MIIQSANNFQNPTRSLPSQPSVQADLSPKDQVQIQSDNGEGPGGGGHFSGGNLLFRLAGGAVNGLACNWLSGGSVGTAALIGGGVGTIVGGAKGALGGALVASRLEKDPGTGALIGGGAGAVFGGLGGAAKGAVTIALTNAFGGGPLAAAGVGAALSLII